MTREDRMEVAGHAADDVHHGWAEADLLGGSRLAGAAECC